MASSHEGAIGNADCGVAVRAMQNWKWKDSRCVWGELVRKTKKISHGNRGTDREERIDGKSFSLELQ